jgi:hypothetical protein
MQFSDAVTDDAPSATPEWISIAELQKAVACSPVFNNLQSVNAGVKVWNALERARNGKSSAGIKIVDREAYALRGKDAEAGFQLAMLACFPECKFAPTTRWDDIKRRIDCMLRIENCILPVDVKAVNALRANGRLQNKYMWVELHASGSLFSGDSTVMAQAVDDKNNTFILFSKEKLKAYVLQNLDQSLPTVYWPEQSVHRAYRKKCGPKKWISLLNIEDAAKYAAIGMVTCKV